MGELDARCRGSAVVFLNDCGAKEARAAMLPDAFGSTDTTDSEALERQRCFAYARLAEVSTGA